jgi:hypothetical protein|tara:strand:- start:365 stop:592 length:228 start_codon:yes stop_codon:yes gene_type:complete
MAKKKKKDGRSFVEHVRKLVINRPRPYTFEVIIDSIEPEVSIQWLSNFCNGKVKNPNADVAVALYDLLSDEPLKF